MKNNIKSIVVIIMALLMAIPVTEAYSQGRVTRKKKQDTEQTQKQKKNQQKQQKQQKRNKPKQNPSKQTEPKPEPKPEPIQVSEPLTGFINGHEWVDLGLPSGLKWATCNVGASSPEDYGNYYAWGEISTKSEYTDANSLTYGKTLSELRSAGIINSNNVLTKSHDAARYKWGSTWRMPTKAEMEELNKKCKWTWTTQGGNTGYKVTGPNGKSIFLPAAGYRYGSSLFYAGEFGNYWSSSANVGTYRACSLYFSSDDHSVDWYGRFLGFSVRPVSE